MSGSDDRSVSSDGSGEVGGRVKEFECIGRIGRLPLVESTALAMSNFYSSVKHSHCVVQTMFENVEDGWSKGADTVSPVTSKIEETLEVPLRAIDNAACVGLDYIEEKIPSVKLPPEKMYEKSKDFVNRRVFEPALQLTFEFYENVRDKVFQYANSACTATSIQDKDTSIGDNLDGAEDPTEDQKRL